MAFKCQRCNTAQPNGTKPVMVVTQTREKKYPVRYRNNDPKDIVIDRGGTGIEIAEEKKMCYECVWNMNT